MAMLLDGPQPPPPEPVVLEAGWDAVGGHARVVRQHAMSAPADRFYVMTRTAARQHLNACTLSLAPDTDANASCLC